METKTNTDSGNFWRRVDYIINQKGLKFTEVCRTHNIAYKTLMSNRNRGEYPGLENACKLAQALGVSTEFLYYGEVYAAENESHYGLSDGLYRLLDEEHDLKCLIWRIVQCSAIQLRTIKTLLSSWGIGMYDATGNSKASV